MNDFLQKPFYHEEFHCRIIHNLASQEMLKTIRNLTKIDQLTQVTHRHYLFDDGPVIFSKLASKGVSVG